MGPPARTKIALWATPKSYSQIYREHNFLNNKNTPYDSVHILP
ncbi:hypothetical protein DCCM_2436 [Desulfocucumis palustris]|uniref:Uncharacterized protein n=1 Tax=Desulfocucumis palustris TaxID=1898651 RepID=A0A2L2XAP5_9FIRM|nr:hypothetical protein DCCM_2436 [Desulfocucumis palustris]